MASLSPRTRQVLALLLAVVVLALVWWARSSSQNPAETPRDTSSPTTSAKQGGSWSTTSGKLPDEAQSVLRAIRHGGPFEYDRDGITFQNRERLLPQRERGYYREYTVPTPGENDRGARRIVTGGDPVEAAWYTADHYRSFQRIEGYP